MLSTLKTSDDKEADINYSIDYCDQQSTGLVIKRRRCRVAPYAHTFSTCAKARWLGCKVIDVLSSLLMNTLNALTHSCVMTPF